MKVGIGCDHAGLELKTEVISLLKEMGIDCVDYGTDGSKSVDYPDFGEKVSHAVSSGGIERGILICGTGIGMSIVANKFPGIRASLCNDLFTARMSRLHNDANILVIGGRVVGKDLAKEIVRIWFSTPFEAGRHINRLNKILNIEGKIKVLDMEHLRLVDPEVYAALQNEMARERGKIVLIASENYVSKAVLEAQGSIFTNKYAEGYPGRRYYGGCEYADKVETLAIKYAQELFGAEHVNVQPHSGSQANMAVYLSTLKPGDTILGMSLNQGGHLSHGSSVNFSGMLFKSISYGVDRETGYIDYERVEKIAREHKPQMIVAGASAYSRILDFKAFSEIAKEVGAFFMADIAHIAGLIAAGIHPSPVPYADFVTTTTHKTLRGPRGGMIMCKAEYGKAIDKMIFPGIQGGPLVHVIAAKAVALKEALNSDFKAYQEQMVKNAKRLGSELAEKGFQIVSGGTDNHLMLVDLSDTHITGKEAEEALDIAGITVNKNAIPFDSRPPAITSGIRLGTPCVTTRGMGEAEMTEIGSIIADVLKNSKNPDEIKRLNQRVKTLCERFPIY